MPTLKKVDSCQFLLQGRREQRQPPGLLLAVGVVALDDEVVEATIAMFARSAQRASRLGSGMRAGLARTSPLTLVNVCLTVNESIFVTLVQSSPGELQAEVGGTLVPVGPAPVGLAAGVRG
jgi:hypothetical protein